MRRIGSVSTRHRPGPTRRVHRAGPLLFLFAAACGTGESDTPSPESVEDQVEAMLQASAEAWNRGDLEGYIGDYAEDATFIGASGVIRGADEIRRRYAEGYWSTGRPPDALRFELLDVRQIRPGAAVVVGRYVLQDRDSRRQTATGFFSLVVERRSGEWKIVHDHSSAAEPG